MNSWIGPEVKHWECFYASVASNFFDMLMGGNNRMGTTCAYNLIKNYMSVGFKLSPLQS